MASVVEIELTSDGVRDSVEITISRGTSVWTPSVRDLPVDYRQALIAWLTSEEGI